jgi:hypothetical protein
MNKKVKITLILCVMLGVLLTQFGKVEAHSVELDPNSLITMPIMIINGNGTITIKSSVTDYTLYFQAVQIPDATYSEIEKTQADGKSALATLEEEYTNLGTEVDTLKGAYNSAADAYKEGLENTELTETELETLKTAYETAKTNYQSKVSEYNAKIEEYNSKVDEINSKIQELTPSYDDSNWTQTTDNKVSVDITEFSGERPYVIWAKLVTSDGTYYDESIYTMTGTKTMDTESPSTSTGEQEDTSSKDTGNSSTKDVEEEKANNTNTTNTTDTSTAKGTLPYTGITSIAIVFIAGIGALGFVFYRKDKYINIK